MLLNRVAKIYQSIVFITARRYNSPLRPSHWMISTTTATGRQIL
jgi:hypothetical protein